MVGGARSGGCRKRRRVGYGQENKNENENGRENYFKNGGDKGSDNDLDGVQNGGKNGRKNRKIGHDNGYEHDRRISHWKGRKKVSKEQTRPFKKRWPESNIFPFLELPGEIRNRIYDIIIHTTRQEFPTSSFSKEHQPGRRSRYDLHPRLEYKAPIPYLNLIHLCRQIRIEFRPLWMQTHQITLGNAPKYIRTFFSPRSKRNVEYYNVSGHLKVYLRYDEIEGRDMLPLIKQSFDFPNRKIQLTHGPSVRSEWADGLTKLVQARNPEWSRLIRGDMLSQVRIDKTHGYITIVVKHRYLEPWMTASKFLHSNGYAELEKLRTRLGLENIGRYRFRLSAKYT